MSIRKTFSCLLFSTWFMAMCGGHLGPFYPKVMLLYHFCRLFIVGFLGVSSQILYQQSTLCFLVSSIDCHYILKTLKFCVLIMPLSLFKLSFKISKSIMASSISHALTPLNKTTWLNANIADNMQTIRLLTQIKARKNLFLCMLSYFECTCIMKIMLQSQNAPI